MTINTGTVSLVSPYSPHKSDEADSRAFDFLTYNGQDDDETDCGELNNRAQPEFDLENAVLKANTGNATVHKLTSEVVKIKVTPPSHPASIHDISHEELKALIRCVQQLVASIDTKGHTIGEIYSTIEAIFKAYFGSDFRDNATILLGTWSYEHFFNFSGTQVSLNRMFYNVLSWHGVDSENLAAAVREARGFAGMSDDEIRNAVRAQFPEPMTYRNALLMARELTNLGLLDVDIMDFFRSYVRHQVQYVHRPPGDPKGFSQLDENNFCQDD